MFSLIYIEQEVANHPTVERLCRRFSTIPQVIIGRYMEVFNRHRQNFRLQKQLPALILAKKHQHFILATPLGYGIGGRHNYYFSHLLNCPFDCRYCFLQGLYSSAHFVFFVNQHDFQQHAFQIDSSETTFFTGYDCDSLAFETITHFVQEWLPVVSQLKGLVEFRTKSIQIRPFLEHKPLANCVIAYTLSPHMVCTNYEHRAPPLEKRLQAIETLQKQGWTIGLRFDPILAMQDDKRIYQTFFGEVFKRVSHSAIHSVSIGAFRSPQPVLKKMISLYPKEPLFALQEKDSKDLLSFCEQEILNYLPKEKFFPCYEQ